MSTAFLLDGGQLFVMQAAVQSIVIAALVPDPGQALTRWTDALIGGAVALVGATVVPAAPLRRPREQAARVMRKIAELLRAAAEVMVDGELEHGLDLLADARSTDALIRELQVAADEGMAVVSVVAVPGATPRQPAADGGAGRPARPGAAQHPGAGPAGRGDGLPPPAGAASRTSRLAVDLAAAADQVADELARRPDGGRGPPGAARVGEATGRVERSDVLAAEAILAQLRSIVVDLLLLTGMDQMESTDALPPPR